MTSKEACGLASTALPQLKAVKCVEYDSLFVFSMIPIASKATKDFDKFLDNLTSVNKKTKEVRDFKPFHISIEEYKNGKEVSNFA